jgi:methionyl aminopeptidase
LDREAALREAGWIAAAARTLAAQLCLPGASLDALCSAVETEIRRLGGQLAFPVQASRNEVAAHFCPRPGERTTCSSGDLLKIDLGVHVDGWAVDTAVTVAVGTSSGGHDLIGAVQSALEAAVHLAKPSVPIARLSAAIESAITSRGFRPMRNLCGHHLARWTVHCPPPVPNFDDGAESVLVPGAIVAIEPFATTGAGIAVERGHAEVFRLRDAAADLEDLDPRLRTALEARRGLPFSRRDLVALPEVVVEDGLATLATTNALCAYPPLVEMSGHAVAQAEHTLLVTETDIVILTM